MERSEDDVVIVRRLLPCCIAVAIFLSPFVGTGAIASFPNPSGSTGPKTLAGTLPDVVSKGRAHWKSRHAPGDTIDIAVSLPLRDSTDLYSYLKQMNDPASPRYHQALSQDAVNALYNPTLSDEQRVIQWLHAKGLTVMNTFPNHLLVDARGTTDQIDNAFGITLNDYTATIHGKDRTFYAPDREPAVDASVGDVVNGVTGLDSVPRFWILSGNGSTNGTTPYYPQDLANAYDVNPLWNAGYTGVGQHIGITLWTVAPSDATLQHWASTTGASVATTTNGRLQIIPVDGGTTAAASPDMGEAGLDIETSAAMAPGATIDYYETPVDSSGNATAQGLLDALNMAGSDANNNRQISNSWGGCEAASASDPFTSSAENIFASNAATGHNYFFSAGDNGSWCDPTGNGIGQDPYPDYPASSPNVTSVGGTRFSAAITGSYPGESSWAYCATCTSNHPEGSGGGYSGIFPRPTWQTGNGLAANGKRGYPDISAVADPNTGTFTCYGSSSACGQFGGTSLASPLWAGMLADVNQYLLAQGKSAAGFLNPTLYSLATGVHPFAPFHDVTSGTNGVYNAGPGWDAVTGWGTPDLYNLARDIGNIVLTSPAGTVTVQSGAGWNMVGGSPLTLWNDSTVNWGFNASTPAWYHPTGTEAAGTGAWEAVPTAGPRSVKVQACSGSVTVSVVAHRWNLVGNPCGLPLALPAATRGYRWDPSTSRYILTAGINAGAAAWVKPESNTLTLILTSTVPA